MLILSCRFYTFHDDFYNSWVRYRKRINSIIVTESPYIHLKHDVFNLYNNFLNTIILFIWFLEYWFPLQQDTMLYAKHLYTQVLIMLVCPETVSRFKAVLQQIYLQLCLDFTLIFYFFSSDWQSTSVIVR